MSEELKLLAGKPISLDQYTKAMQASKYASWSGGGYIKESSYLRPAFSLPAGHTFNRISTAAEKTFGDSTYATHSISDFNRYIAGFSGEKSGIPLKHITFKATKEIKVPDLTTTLDSLETVLKKYSSDPISKEEVVRRYQGLSGGNWSDKHALGLFSELRKRGFGAIVDEMDAGVIGETPLVIFSKAVKPPKNAVPLTNSAMQRAKEALIELENRKFADA